MDNKDKIIIGDFDYLLVNEKTGEQMVYIGSQFGFGRIITKADYESRAKISNVLRLQQNFLTALKHLTPEEQESFKNAMLTLQDFKDGMDDNR